MQPKKKINYMWVMVFVCFMLGFFCLGFCSGNKGIYLAAITEAFALPHTPLLVIAIGKGAEQIQLTEISAEESHTYYRKEGIHYVPKVKLDDLVIS